MPRKQDRPRHSVSVYAIKPSFRSPDDIIKPRAEMTSRNLRIGSTRSHLYIAPAERRVPRWAEIFGNRIDVDELGIYTSNAAGVLLIPTSQRFFALTFGFGRYLLRNEVIEERFGLKATLNAIDPESIRSLDRKSFESLARQVHEQATRPAPARDFGLDIEQDMLRAVVGTPKDPSFASRMYGKDAVVANINHGLEDIVNFLERCDAFARDKSYKKTYPWVDHIAEISDKAKISDLDESLLKRIKHRNFDGLWLALPERIEWHRVDGFKFTTRATTPTAPDLQLADLLATIGDLTKLSTKTLKSRQVYVYAHDVQHPIEKWSVYKCICFEATIDDNTFLLNGGKWYCVDSDFTRTINESFEKMPRSDLELPECTETDEGEYNERVCAVNQRRFELLDRRLVNHGGGHSSVEICDILTNDRRLVHIKKYGGSSVLSHLFSQAAVSGELLCSDVGFRKKANTKIKKNSHKLSEEAFDPRNYEVVLGIITWSKKSLALPFFSRVNLRATARRLKNFGYKVTLLSIPGPRPEPSKRKSDA